MIREIIMPKLGETMEEGYLAAWKKEEGQAVEKGEVLFEVMSDKTTFEVESDASGYLRKKLFEPSENPIPVTTVIGYLADSPDEPLPEKPADTRAASPTPTAPQSPAASSAQAPDTGRVRASPAARRLAAERGIDLSLVRGTGPGGRIERDDVANFAPSSANATAGYEVVPMTPLRRIIAERLTKSKTTIPHFYLEGSVSASNLSRLRDAQKKQGAEITYTDLLLYFTARAVQEFPLVNAAFVDGQVRVYPTVDIGLAVALDDGLVVPVIRDCVHLALAALSAEVKRLASSARAGTLTPQEMEHCRFVVSNLGMFGVERFLPIINPPGTAIMGVSAILPTPVARGETVVVEQVMRISLSFDHRVIDGSYGARFFVRLKELLETGELGT